MRSLLAVRLGSQDPTVLHQPPDVVSLAAAEEAIELADAYGICDGNPLSDSQKLTLRNAGGERADGSWAATRIADFGPRQGTGKNDKIAAWELAHLILFGTDLILHTAHEFPTANESFLRLVAVFENYDDLRRRVARIRYANGEQGIELLSGQRLKYRARTGGSGRGFAKAGLLVYDEAQHLSSEHIAASGPAKLANPNSQTWYAGSGGLTSSRVAWQIRRQALLETGGRLAYTEMTGETLTVTGGSIGSVAPDPLDRDVWYRCIPGLGRWVTEEGVEALYAELGPELFAREILCVWDPEPTSGVESVFGEAWAAWRSGSVQPRPEVFSLTVHPDRSSASIGVADSDGQCALSDHRPNVGWAVDEAIRIWSQYRAPFAIQSNGAAGALIVDLERAGVKVIPYSPALMRDACGQLFDAVAERKGGVRSDGDLDRAVGSAVKRTSADAWVWDQRGDADVSPLVAITIARHAALAGTGPSVYEEKELRVF